MSGPGDLAGVARCVLCGKPAVTRVRDPDRHLCDDHFIQFFEEGVLRTITAGKMVRPGDRIAIALSGGKDSTALLLVLTRLLPAWDDVHPVAITIDEGIAGYRQETLRAARELTSRHKIEHHIVSFEELFNRDLDQILVGREQRACTICGILRKKALVVAAERYGATKIATGHNLDDEAQSVLMNALRGDLPRLIRNAAREKPGFLLRIKPLCLTPEREIALYLMLRDAWTELPECPYTRFALRAEVRGMLSTLEYRHPGTMLHLIDAKKKIERYCAGVPGPSVIRRCQECGDPCSGEFCQVCRLRHSLG
ncbi:MAG: TIGR00269 family protein [Methanoregula sp.]